MPRWYGALLAGGAAGVAACGLVGLLLAVAGLFVWWAALAAGVVGAAGGALVGWRVTPATTARAAAPSSHGWAAGAVALAAAFVVGNWAFVADHAMLERDPGLYTMTARWLDREGSLFVDAAAGPFDGAGGVSFLSVGMYEHGDGGLEFQAQHLTPVLLATAQGAAGTGALQRLPLVLVAGGLLAVWALAARVTGSGAVSLVVTAALALSLPVLGVARDTLSEPVVLILLWAALWCWTVAVDTGRAAAAGVAGLLLGACVATRIDAAAYLLPVPVVLALHGRRTGWTLPRALLAGLVPGVLVAVLDVGLRSRGYLADLEVEVVLLYAALAAGVAGGVVVARWRGGPPLPARPDVVAVAVAAVLVVLWFVRPHLQTVRDRPSDLVANIQLGQGDDVDGRRRYHELSMVWQSWYLGVPLLAAAVAGAAIAARRLVAGVDRALLLPLAALGASTALYLWRPAIAPDHLWASRRFVPAALPLWCVLAGLAAVAGWRAAAMDRRPAVTRGFVAAALVAAAVVPVAARLWPVREFREFDGFGALVDRTCAAVGADGAVVLPEDSTAGPTLAQTIRSTCGVPAALVDGTADVEALAADWEAEGRQLWVVADVAEQLPDGGAGGFVELGPVSSDRMLEDTLTSPPDEYFTFTMNAVAARAAGG